MWQEPIGLGLNPTNDETLTNPPDGFTFSGGAPGDFFAGGGGGDFFTVDGGQPPVASQGGRIEVFLPVPPGSSSAASAVPQTTNAPTAAAVTDAVTQQRNEWLGLAIVFAVGWLIFSK